MKRDENRPRIGEATRELVLCAVNVLGVPVNVLIGLLVEYERTIAKQYGVIETPADPFLIVRTVNNSLNAAANHMQAAGYALQGKKRPE